MLKCGSVKLRVLGEFDADTSDVNVPLLPRTPAHAVDFASLCINKNTAMFAHRSVV